MFQHDHPNASWFKIEIPVHGGRGGIVIWENNDICVSLFGKNPFIFLENSKGSIGKDEKKKHNKFHHDQINESLFKIGGTNG